jgi:hypothetical protein
LRFTALLHHIYNLDTLRMAYFSLKKEAAPGVDGETWRHYGEQLEANLQDLSERLKRGAYRAKPVRRVYIPLRPTGGRDRSESRRWKNSSSCLPPWRIRPGISPDRQRLLLPSRQAAANSEPGKLRNAPPIGSG